ncbi:DUF6934 family protein [Runella slithyformis]|uniref:Uncharacterized protein n=1 Tax=Runella slithyformis (strain ATCC 29530 / DSM 19594 / LMG 11500 / NCIMB 11436 / LSU 4) TaxID=761193 RepID=A0A7U3ZH92_RUNSL|nr:hypothetical protein [Runella slithyformis]AEI47209.1 hypothetical protein Runsl_0769 [Runella slithyformis DSM 19594]
MNQERYEFETDPTATVYEFESVGKRGIFKKRITFQLIQQPNVYNLGFGDINLLTNQIDDLAVTNNGDSQKVLITVANAVLNFTRLYPEAAIFATGSTPARTRLYQIGITNNLNEITENFEVWGYSNEHWSMFKINIAYEAFLVKRKQ